VSTPKKDFLATMFGWMMPRGPAKLKLSKMHFFGSGTALMRYVIKNEHVKMVPEWIAEARVAVVRFVGCTMSVDVIGIAKEELLEGVELGGVASFLNAVEGANMTLFI
jgi:peroxiredoxin family protein